jgi:hypothetical protein
MSDGNLLSFLRLLGDRPQLLDSLKDCSKDTVIEAAGKLGYPFTAAEFDRLIWGLEERLAQHRGEAFDAHFPLFRTLWGRYYLEVLVVDLLPSVDLLLGSAADPMVGSAEVSARA